MTYFCSIFGRNRRHQKSFRNYLTFSISIHLFLLLNLTKRSFTCGPKGPSSGMLEAGKQGGHIKTLPLWPCGLRRRVNSTYNSGMLLYEKIPRSNTHVNKRNYILKRNSCVCMYLLFPEIRSSWKWNRWRYSQLSAGISQWSEKMTCAISTITCTTK